ncbi:MAG: DNA-processing protein DprA [Actinomycetota bacterium]
MSAFDFSDERLARIMWSAIAEPGDRRLAQLIAQIGPTIALHGLVERDIPWMARYRVRFPHISPERELAQFKQLGGRVVIPSDDEWPMSLAALSAPPPCLWLRGPLSLQHLEQRSVAIVGARAASAYGEHVAGEIAAGVADRGFVVLSGLAYGVDAAAHRAAIHQGRSAAVLAGGADRPYPRGHDRLMASVMSEGVVMSEVPPGSAPTRGRFLHRNRLIAALGQGTVVVEAAIRSGALNTARTAAHLGRVVGAVPGPVTAPGSAGCHELIRSGRAVLVTDADEVVDLVGRLGDDAAPSRATTSSIRDGLDELTSQVLDAVPVRDSNSANQICIAAGLDLPTVQSALGRLSLLGLVSQQDGGWRLARRGNSHHGADVLC